MTKTIPAELVADLRSISAITSPRAANLALRDAADALTAAQQRIAELEGEEAGFGSSLGSSAVAHLREMYRPAYDALGSSGRTSLRNFINARHSTALKQGEAITDAQGIAWFERTFGVPLGDKPGERDVASVRSRALLPDEEKPGSGEANDA